jgi:hypothetical protein
MELKYTFSFKSVRTFGGKDLVNSRPSEYTIETIKEMVSAGVKASLPFVKNVLSSRQKTGQLYQSVYTTQSKRFKNGYIGAWINYMGLDVRNRRNIHTWEGSAKQTALSPRWLTTESLAAQDTTEADRFQELLIPQAQRFRKL